MKMNELGRTGIRVSDICLGTMTFGEQTPQADAYAQMDMAVEAGVTFFDAAEMYPTNPVQAATQGRTEEIVGDWLKQSGKRNGIVVATKITGDGHAWIRNGGKITRASVGEAIEGSLRRLRTDRIDLYQVHWPNRNTPAFGALYLDPAQDRAFSPIAAQLEALDGLVRAGKVRSIGLSNETPWGVMAFLQAAERAGLARVVSVQNPYALVNRSVDNGLDEVLLRENIGLLAYSPLGFGTLTGKYDASIEAAPEGRIARFETVRKGRWARGGAIEAARRYNALAREHGLTPTQLALAFCYRSWRVASTIIGVTSIAQLDENLDAWGTALTPELLAAVDAVRLGQRDPAQ